MLYIQTGNPWIRAVYLIEELHNPMFLFLSQYSPKAVIHFSSLFYPCIFMLEAFKDCKTVLAMHLSLNDLELEES